MSLTASKGFRELAQYVSASKSRDRGFSGRAQFWIEQFGDRDITSVTTEGIEDAIDSLIARGKTKVVVGRDGNTLTEPGHGKLANATINRYISTLGTIFRTLRNERILRKSFLSPLRGFGRLREDGGRTVTVTVEDVKRLVAACRLSRNRQLAALVAMACTTGWRKGNLQALTWADIDLDTGTADYHTSKNGQPLRTPLLPWVVVELKRVKPAKADPGEFVFGPGNPAKAFRNALKQADLPEEWSFHHCRHIAASVLAQSGASVVTIMQCLNHKTPSMAMRYAHLNVDALRSSIGKAWA